MAKTNTPMRITYRANAPRDQNQYQHQHLEISFDLPDDVTFTDATYLVQQLVLMRLGERCDDRKRCRQIFGWIFPDEDFDDYLDDCN